MMQGNKAMQKDRISQLRHVSRKLIRELGMLSLNEAQKLHPIGMP